MFWRLPTPLARVSRALCLATSFFGVLRPAVGLFGLVVGGFLGAHRVAVHLLPYVFGRLPSPGNFEELVEGRLLLFEELLLELGVPDSADELE